MGEEFEQVLTQYCVSLQALHLSKTFQTGRHSGQGFGREHVQPDSALYIVRTGQHRDASVWAALPVQRQWWTRYNCKDGVGKDLIKNVSGRTWVVTTG